MTGKLIVRDGATYRTTYSQFDAYGNPAAVEEAGPNGGVRSKTLTYSLDPAKWLIRQLRDEVTSVPDPTNPSRTVQVDSIARLFDSSGNVTQVTQNGVTTAHTYDSEGNIATTTFPRGLTHTYSNYRRGIPQSESQPEGITIARTVSAAGNVTLERNGEGHATQYGSGKAVATRISRADDAPLGLAGLWARWRSPENETVYSYTLLTINADRHPFMRQFHRPTDEKRMLVILPEDRYGAWLRAEAKPAIDFLQPYPAEALRAEMPPRGERPTPDAGARD